MVEAAGVELAVDQQIYNIINAFKSSPYNMPTTQPDYWQDSGKLSFNNIM